MLCLGGRLGNSARWVSGNITIKLGYANAKIYKKKEVEDDVVPLAFPAPEISSSADSVHSG